MESGLHRPEEAEQLRERVRFPAALLRRLVESETTKRRRESGDAL